MATETLSPTMQACVEYMRHNGGKIFRYPGGYWADADWKHNGPHHGTTTVQALVTRGVADYTDWQQTKNGRFPIEATLRNTK